MTEIPKNNHLPGSHVTPPLAWISHAPPSPLPLHPFLAWISPQFFDS